MHPSWRVMASPNPAAQLNLIRWSHPIHQWSTSAWHPSVPPHRRFLRFFNVAGCEKPSADLIGSNKKQLKNTRNSLAVDSSKYRRVPIFGPGMTFNVTGSTNSVLSKLLVGAFGAFKLSQPPICQCWTLPHPSAALLQPSKPPATNTRRSSKPATAQPERPTAMVGPEENVMLVASKILGDWETWRPFGQMDKLMGPWKKTGFAVAVCKTWWIVAEGSLYSSRCILYVFFCQATRYSNDLLYHQSHQKRWYAWKASTKDSTLGYLQRARGWSANITPGRLLPHHWLPKINCKKKHLISDSPLAQKCDYT